MEEHSLSVEGLEVSYGSNVIMKGVSFQLPPGKSLAILGPSGSGKTTLLLCILGLVMPQSGQIRIGGREMTAAGASARARIRRDLMGAVFQTGELLPELSPLENVALPGLLASRPVESVMNDARALLTRLGVGAGDRPIGSFSGGEQQRVAVARALINSPALVVADEPTGSLDEDTALEVEDVLFGLPRQFRCGLVLVTHDRRAAFRADEVWKFHNGALSQVQHIRTGL